MARKVVYRSCILLLALVLNAKAYSVAGSDMYIRAEEQTGALCLRGEVLKVELAREDVHSIVFDVKLKLEFVNTGNKPIILLLRPFWLGATSLARSPEDAAAYKYVYSSGHWPSVSTAPEWSELRQRLDQPSPPADLTRIIAPGESFPYEAGATLYIEKAGSLDRTSQRWDVIRQTSPLWLQVTLEMWPVNVEPRADPDRPEFGKKLQRRWQQFGALQLDRLTSEPMPLDFSP